VKRNPLLTVVVVLVALICAVGAIWTAWWSLRFGLTPRPALSALHTAVRFAVVFVALALWPFRPDPMERVTLLCAVLGAGASALFGLGLRSPILDVVRLLFHFFGYALGVALSVRWLVKSGVDR
jgi:hypothetical protein